MRYRTGRHNPRIVYRQSGEHPSDSDDMMAVFFDGIDALAVVSLLNGDEDDALWADDPIEAVRRNSEPVGPVVGGIATGSRALADEPEQLAAAGRKPTSSQIPSDCVYDVWGADFGAQAGAQCLNSDPAHQGAHHAPLPADEPTSIPLDEAIADACASSPEFARAYAEAERRHNGAPVDEPAPVPPPVDALLERVERVAYFAHRAAQSEMAADADKAEQHNASYRVALDHVAADLRALWASGVEEGRRREEQESLQVIEERDEARETADRLANAIGRHLGLDVGEHSNMNDPWMRALDALAEADGGKFVKAAYEDGVAEGRRQRDEEIRAEVFASARAVAEAGFGPVPESVTVTYDRVPVRSCWNIGLHSPHRWLFSRRLQQCPGVDAPAERITAATAHLLPEPKGRLCAAGCGHATLSHREHGCDVCLGSDKTGVRPCECPAPFGRILPSAEAGQESNSHG